MISALKHSTPTSQTFWGCDDTNTGGQLGVFVNGVLYTGDILVAANDYTGSVTVNGLRPDTEYSFQMAIDGTAVGPEYKFRTPPPIGSSGFDILIFGDCFDPEPIIDLIRARETNARLIISTETSYIEQVRTGQPADNGRDPTSANPTGYQNYLDWYRGWYRHIWSFRGWQRLVNSIPIISVWHNHEFCSDTTGNCPTVGEIQYDAAIKAFREYEGAAQPSASDTGITVDSWPNPVVYLGHRIGNIDIVMTDITSYSWGALDYQMTNPTRGSQQQINWAKTYLSQTPQSFVVWYHPSNICSGSAANGGNAYEEWIGTAAGNYKDGLLYFLSDGIPQPAIVFSANTHTAHARGVYHSSVNNSYPLPELNISPLKQTSRATHGFLSTDNPGLWKNFAWKNTHNKERDPTLVGWPNPISDLYVTKGWRMEWYYGVLSLEGHRIVAKIKEVISGAVVFSMAIYQDKRYEFWPK